MRGFFLSMEMTLSYGKIWKANREIVDEMVQQEVNHRVSALMKR